MGEKVLPIARPWSRTDPDPDKFLVKLFFSLLKDNSVKGMLKFHKKSYSKKKLNKGWVNMKCSVCLQTQLPLVMFTLLKRVNILFLYFIFLLLSFLLLLLLFSFGCFFFHSVDQADLQNCLTHSIFLMLGI